MAKSLAAAGVAIAALMLAMFGLAQALGIPLLTDESPDLGGAGAGAAVLSFGLLVGDVVLPVPSSGVMTVNGALFGPAGGALLSWVASTTAACVAWAIGRRGGPLLVRVGARPGRERAAAALDRRGLVAVAVSRPVPILAETVAVLAGASGMPFRRFAIAAIVGALPPAVAYALAGAAAASL